MVSFLKSIRFPTSKFSAWSDRGGNSGEGERLLAAGDYGEAEYHLTLAVADADLNSLSTNKRIRLRLQLAEAQRRLNKLADAEQSVRQAIRQAERDTPIYLQCLDALAEVHMAQGNYDSAEKLSQDGLRIESAMPRPDPLRMARRVHRLGMARYRSSPTKDAVTALQKGLELHEQAYGLHHEETVRVLSELGAIYRAHGLHKQAQDCLRRSMRYYQQNFGPDDPRSVNDLHQLAGSLEECGDTAGAGVEYERVLLLKEREVGKDQDELAILQFSLANQYIGWGSYPRARELLLEAIGTFKRTSGPRLAVAYEAMAQVEELTGRFNDAVRQLEHAGKVWEKCPGRHAEQAANLEYRAELMEQLRRKPEATWLREQASRISGRAAGA